MRALLIVDHGSRLPEANKLLEEVERLLREDGTYPVVHHAHMELASPTIGEAFDRCVADGATDVVIHPYFLGPGRHSQRDIPALAAEAAARHPGVRYCVTEPLGVHRKILDVVLERAGRSAP